MYIVVEQPCSDGRSGNIDSEEKEMVVETVKNKDESNLHDIMFR